MTEALYNKAKSDLPGLLQCVIGDRRATAVLSWLAATDHVRGQGSEGTSGRITAERELVSRALEQWLKEASESEAEQNGMTGRAEADAGSCRDCGRQVDADWWDRRRCEQCWASVKRARYQANQERRRERRRGAAPAIASRRAA